MGENSSLPQAGEISQGDTGPSPMPTVCLVQAKALTAGVCMLCQHPRSSERAQSPHVLQEQGLGVGKGLRLDRLWENKVCALTWGRMSESSPCQLLKMH